MVQFRLKPNVILIEFLLKQDYAGKQNQTLFTWKIKNILFKLFVNLKKNTVNLFGWKLLNYITNICICNFFLMCQIGTSWKFITMFTFCLTKFTYFFSKNVKVLWLCLHHSQLLIKKIRFSTLNLLGVSRSRDLLRICSVNCISVQTNSILHCKSRDPNNFQLEYFHHLIIFCFWLIHKLPDKLNFYYDLIKTWPNAITDEISLYHIPERIAFVVTMQSNCRRNSPLVTFNSIGGLWTKLAWTMSLQQWCL